MFFLHALQSDDAIVSKQESDAEHQQYGQGKTHDDECQRTKDDQCLFDGYTRPCPYEHRCHNGNIRCYFCNILHTFTFGLEHLARSLNTKLGRRPITKTSLSSLGGATVCRWRGGYPCPLFLPRVRSQRSGSLRFG